MVNCESVNKEGPGSFQLGAKELLLPAINYAEKQQATNFLRLIEVDCDKMFTIFIFLLY